MNAREAIPGLVRRIVLDGDWKDAPLILGDALEEIGECRAARLLRARHKRAVNEIASCDNNIAFALQSGMFISWTTDDVKRWRYRSIVVFRLYVARKFPDSESMYLDSLAGWLPPLPSAELRILSDPAGVQSS